MMKRLDFAILRGLLLTLMAVVWMSPAHAQFGDSRDNVKVTVTPLSTTLSPGDDLPVAVTFTMAPGWHIYAADSPIPSMYYKTVVEVELDPRLGASNDGFIQWPAKHVIDFFGDKLDVYKGTATAFVPVTIHPDAPAGRYTITIRTGFQACDDVQCLQPTAMPPKPGDLPSEEWMLSGNSFTVTIVDDAGAASNTGDAPPVFASFDNSVFGRIHGGERAPEGVDFDFFGLVKFTLNVNGEFGLILLLLITALGGMMLNMTPCVLPVIPLKIMALKQGGGGRLQTFMLGVAMALGILAFWLALGCAIAFIKNFGTISQLFQSPTITIAIGVFIAVLAIGMCGVFSLRLPGAVYSFSPKHDSLSGSFAFGILAALLSTPCTAPFMGAAAAWGVKQEPSTVLLTFGAIGAGMGIPYLILAAFPALVKWLPKSGPMSELIKQLMGIFLLAAAAYFIGIGASALFVMPPDPPSRAYWWFVAGFIAIAGLWLAVRGGKDARSTGGKVSSVVIGILVIALGVGLGIRLTDKGPIKWVYYTAERFDQAKAQGNVVVLEFTAEWCINCHTLEQTVLRTQSVVEALNSEGVTPIKVDITNYPAASEFLASVNRVTIPLLIVMKDDGTEVFKGDAYTPQQVLDAIAEARQ
ncbi:MAG: DUF255 domain-containing protein [Phycisphaerales bacterium]